MCNHCWPETVCGVVCHELNCPNRQAEDDTLAAFLMKEHGLTEDELERRANSAEWFDMLAGQ